MKDEWPEVLYMDNLGWVHWERWNFQLTLIGLFWMCCHMHVDGLYPRGVINHYFWATFHVIQFCDHCNFSVVFQLELLLSHACHSIFCYQAKMGLQNYANIKKLISNILFLFWFIASFHGWMESLLLKGSETEEGHLIRQRVLPPLHKHNDTD